MATKSLPPGDSPAFWDPTFYRALIGSLLYLTFNRPDISFVVHAACQHMQAPTEFDFLQVKQILRYIKGTINYGHFITSKSDLSLKAYSDSDWAGCSETTASPGHPRDNQLSRDQAQKSNTGQCLSLVTTAELIWLTHLLICIFPKIVLPFFFVIILVHFT